MRVFRKMDKLRKYSFSALIAGGVCLAIWSGSRVHPCMYMCGWGICPPCPGDPGDVTPILYARPTPEDLPD